METLFTTEMLIGPLSGLAISLFFCFAFLRRFEATLERLLSVFETELELCHHRHSLLLTELTKIKMHQSPQDWM